MIKWSLDSKSELKAVSPGFHHKFQAALSSHLATAKLQNPELRDAVIVFTGDAVEVSNPKSALSKPNKLRKAVPYGAVENLNEYEKNLLEKIKPLVKDAIRSTMQNLR